MPTQKKTTKSQQVEDVKATKDAQVAVTAHVKGNGRKHLPKPSVQVLMDTDDVVKAQFGGFVNFLRDNGIVGLAIGFVAGSQAQAVVKQLIADFIDPATKLFFGGVKLSERTFYWQFHGRGEVFKWGDMVYTLLNLIIVLGTIYALIKILKLDRLQKPKEVVAEPAKDDKKKKK